MIIPHTFPKKCCFLFPTQIYEFKDKDDTAQLDDKSVKEFNVIDLNKVTFDNITHTSDLSKHSIKWTVTEGNNDTLHIQKDGSLSFGVRH